MQQAAIQYVQPSQGPYAGQWAGHRIAAEPSPRMEGQATWQVQLVRSPKSQVLWKFFGTFPVLAMRAFILMEAFSCVLNLAPICNQPLRSQSSC